MNNKYALVTGASKGIGAAIAIQLAKDGFNIFLHYNKDKSGAESVKNIIESKGRTAYLINADITNNEEVVNMFSEIKTVTNSLNVLVNNAGFDFGKMIEDYTYEEMKYIVDLILMGRFATTKEALPFLKNSEYPTIINIASRMGKEKTITTVGPYAAAEAGIIKFTKCCALEFAPYSIRANCVAPGLVRTTLTENMFIEQEGSKEAAEELWSIFNKNNPSHRVGEPQDIANVVSFLVSEKSSYINGEIIGVNGGSNLG